MMSPIKFFRKYSRVLVLVLMSLLLVIFLLDPVLMRRGNGDGLSREKLGTAFGRTITLGDLNRAKADVELLRNLNFPVQVFGPGDSDSHLTALLLMEEADRLGIRFGQQQALEELRRRQVPDFLIDRLRETQRRSLASIYDAVGRFLACFTAAQLHVSAARESEPRLESAYRLFQQTARVRLSVIESRALRSRVPPPSEEELLAFFEAGKNRETRHTADALVFGYRRPDRVRLEYLTIDPAPLEARVRISEREARRHYEQNRAHYAALLRTETAPATPPEFDQLSQELRERIRSDARRARAIAEAHQRINTMLEEARIPWAGQPIDKDGYRTVPPSGTLIEFTALRDKHAREYPVEYGRTELIAASDVTLEPGIGQARVGVGEASLPLSQVVTRVKGLYTPQPHETFVPINVNEPSPDPAVVYRPDPLSRSPQPYHMYLFRITEVAPAGPPDSLDEVREQVLKDYTLSRAHELAGEEARKLAQRAREIGLEAAVAEASELRQQLEEAQQAQATDPNEPNTPFLAHLGPFEPPGRFGRRASFIPKVGSAPKLHEEIFKLSQEQPGPGPADESDSENRAVRPVVAVPLPPGLKWIVGELLEVRPLYAGDFAEQREALSEQVDNFHQQIVWRLWFDPENVRRRTGFQPAEKR
jgi:hypothetical protein